MARTEDERATNPWLSQLMEKFALGPVAGSVLIQELAECSDWLVDLSTLAAAWLSGHPQIWL
jgi:hypothetical protein